MSRRRRSGGSPDLFPAARFLHAKIDGTVPPILRGALAAGAACLLTACGAAGPPHPPRVEQPEKIEDLAAVQRGHAVELTFTLPDLATDGERLTRPLEIQIFRATRPASENAPALPAMNAPWRTLEPQVARQFSKGKSFVYPLELSPDDYRQLPGAKLTFAVRAATRGFRHRAAEGELSNQVALQILDVPPPPEELKVATTEKALVVSWSPPGGTAAPPAGYRVYRSSRGKDGEFAPLGETAEAAFRDADFQFGRTYAYKVRSLAKSGDQTAESDDSAAVEVSPRDTFPPAPPSGLTAVFTPSGTELVWKPNTESDLAGYDLYRREEGSPAQKLNGDLLAAPVFRDTTAAAGHTYIYTATAVDLAANESAPSEEAKVEAQ